MTVTPPTPPSQGNDDIPLPEGLSGSSENSSDYQESPHNPDKAPDGAGSRKSALGIPAIVAVVITVIGLIAVGTLWLSSGAEQTAVTTNTPESTPAATVTTPVPSASTPSSPESSQDVSVPSGPPVAIDAYSENWPSISEAGESVFDQQKPYLSLLLGEGKIDFYHLQDGQAKKVEIPQGMRPFSYAQNGYILMGVDAGAAQAPLAGYTSPVWLNLENGQQTPLQGFDTGKAKVSTILAVNRAGRAALTVTELDGSVKLKVYDTSGRALTVRPLENTDTLCDMVTSAVVACKPKIQQESTSYNTTLINVDSGTEKKISTPIKVRYRPFGELLYEYDDSVEVVLTPRRVLDEHMNVISDGFPLDACHVNQAKTADLFRQAVAQYRPETGMGAIITARGELKPVPCVPQAKSNDHMLGMVSVKPTNHLQATQCQQWLVDDRGGLLCRMFDESTGAANLSYTSAKASEPDWVINKGWFPEHSATGDLFIVTGEQGFQLKRLVYPEK